MAAWSTWPHRSHRVWNIWRSWIWFTEIWQRETASSATTTLSRCPTSALATTCIRATTTRRRAKSYYLFVGWLGNPSCLWVHPVNFSTIIADDETRAQQLYIAISRQLKFTLWIEIIYSAGATLGRNAGCTYDRMQLALRHSVTKKFDMLSRFNFRRRRPVLQHRFLKKYDRILRRNWHVNFRRISFGVLFPSSQSEPICLSRVCSKMAKSAFRRHC